jgi:hypothetical protein
MQTEADTAPERKLDRRTLIKRAAAAGAVAWTAPVVINSMASPAAAATCACAGLFYVQFVNNPICGDSDNSYASDRPCQPDSSSVVRCGTCKESNGAPAYDYCISTSTCAGNQELVTWTILPNCTTGTGPDRYGVPSFADCKFVSGAGTAKNGSTQCVIGQVAPDGLSISFDRGETINSDDNAWTEWRLVLCCATPATPPSTTSAT